MHKREKRKPEIQIHLNSGTHQPFLRKSTGYQASAHSTCVRFGFLYSAPTSRGQCDHMGREWPLCGPFSLLVPKYKRNTLWGGQSLNKMENRTSKPLCKRSLYFTAISLENKAFYNMENQNQSKAKQTKTPNHHVAQFTVSYLRTKVILIIFANPMPRAQCQAYIRCPITWFFMKSIKKTFY